MKDCCQRIKLAAGRARVAGGSWPGGLLLSILLAGLAGCASKGPAVPEVVEKQAPPIVEEMTIEHLADGRRGFVITEIPLEPAVWSADFETAVSLLENESYAAAITLLETVVSESPGVSAPYINLAMAYRRTGQLQAAEEHLQTALQLVPEHPVASNEYGLLLRQAGRFQKAREVYEAGLEAFPEYLPLRRNLGILCELYLDDPACALEQYTLYGDGRPQDEDVQLWIADLNLRIGTD